MTTFELIEKYRIKVFAHYKPDAQKPSFVWTAEMSPNHDWDYYFGESVQGPTLEETVIAFLRSTPDPYKVPCTLSHDAAAWFRQIRADLKQWEKTRELPAVQTRVIVACSGLGTDQTAQFYRFTFLTSREQLDAGAHRKAALDAVANWGYRGPFVVFDERDGPKWLFDHLFPKEKPCDAAG